MSADMPLTTARRRALLVLADGLAANRPVWESVTTTDPHALERVDRLGVYWQTAQSLADHGFVQISIEPDGRRITLTGDGRLLAAGVASFSASHGDDAS